MACRTGTRTSRARTTGGGFTLGAGYAHHVSAYNMLDVRGSYTILGYKRIEAEFTAPRLFHRRGSLSVLGGWREATQAAFYGFGMQTSLDDRADFDFRQPSASANLDAPADSAPADVARCGGVLAVGATTGRRLGFPVR